MPALLECELSSCKAESSFEITAADGGLVCCASCAAYAQFLAVALGIELDIRPLDTGRVVTDTAPTLELVQL